jgi:hypothetical protein
MSEEEEVARGGPGHARRVKSLDPKIFGSATPRVQELTIADLNQLAAVASGAAVPAGKLAALDADDIRSLDDAFHEAKLQSADLLARRLKQREGVAEDEEFLDGWSCCCCSPCCCCAAADVDPFE